MRKLKRYIPVVLNSKGDWITGYNRVGEKEGRKLPKTHIEGLCNVKGKKLFVRNPEYVNCKRCLIELSHYRPWKQRVIANTENHLIRETLEKIEKDNFCCQVPQEKIKVKPRYKTFTKRCPHCRRVIKTSNEKVFEVE